VPSKRKRIREGARLPHVDKAGIDSTKLKDYVLHPDHPDKAQGFATQLGIFRKDWRDLHDQILERLPESHARRLALPTNDRFEFTVDIPIDGLNGKRRMVVTSWSVDARHEPWFVTAHLKGVSTSKPGTPC
jgi:hypothetical protein